MNCFEVQEKLIDLLAGDITEEEKALIHEHLDSCPVCTDDFTFISQCLQCWTPVASDRFTEAYWEEFEIAVHEKICQCRPHKPFPYKIVVPIAISVLGTAGICFLLFRPSPKEVVKPVPDQPADPFEEVYDLSPEEQEEFIRIINQRYPGN